jgi:hypothetical protein
MKEWYRKLSQDSCFCKNGGPGRPRKSIRHATQKLQTPPTTVWRVVKKHLVKKPYRQQLLQALSNNDIDHSTFGVNFLDISDEKNLMPKVVFRNEAVFICLAK